VTKIKKLRESLMTSTEMSDSTQENMVNFDKFIDDELLRKRRTVDVIDSPLRALERKTRRTCRTDAKAEHSEPTLRIRCGGR
jgi:hypothetical protein